ncbi:hypothetical protein DVH05_023023 [Phytophthora capsici]|nr:hypothetical protein DVH05_023023 [Phytophthora capsici]
MRKDAADASAGVPSDATAQEAVEIRPDRYSSEPGVQADVPDDGDDAEDTGGRQTSEVDEPAGGSKNLQEGKRMDVEEGRDVEAGHTSESDVVREDGDSANASDTATVSVDPPLKYHTNWEA